MATLISQGISIDILKSHLAEHEAKLLGLVELVDAQSNVHLGACVEVVDEGAQTVDIPEETLITQQVMSQRRKQQSLKFQDAGYVSTGSIEVAILEAEDAVSIIFSRFLLSVSIDHLQDNLGALTFEDVRMGLQPLFIASSAGHIETRKLFGRQADLPNLSIADIDKSFAAWLQQEKGHSRISDIFSSCLHTFNLPQIMRSSAVSNPEDITACKIDELREYCRAAGLIDWFHIFVKILVKPSVSSLRAMTATELTEKYKGTDLLAVSDDATFELVVKSIHKLPVTWTRPKPEKACFSHLRKPSQVTISSSGNELRFGARSGRSLLSRSKTAGCVLSNQLAKGRWRRRRRWPSCSLAICVAAAGTRVLGGGSGRRLQYSDDSVGWLRGAGGGLLRERRMEGRARRAAVGCRGRDGGNGGG
eukprot:COSAG01_NODE_15968_length_1282_cov_1.573964_1_plen_419_part_01